MSTSDQPATVQPSLPGSPRRIVVTDPSPSVAGLYADAIRGGVEHVQTLPCGPDDAGLAGAVLGADLAVCALPEDPGQALGMLGRVLLLRPNLFVLALTPAERPDAVDLAVQAGAGDVLVRCTGLLEQLPAAVRKNLALMDRARDHAERTTRVLMALEELRAENRSLQTLVDRLESMAMTDPLTGLGNRRALGKRLEELFSLASRRGEDLACLSIDVDGLKRVNDTLGHDAGDDLLRAAGEVLTSACRRGDFAARTGGDEFVVVLPHATSTTAVTVARRVQHAFEERTDELRRRLEGGSVRVVARTPRPSAGDPRHASRVGLSIGVSSLEISRASTPEQLLARADAALYTAKHAGGAGIELDAGGPTVNVVGVRSAA